MEWPIGAVLAPAYTAGGFGRECTGALGRLAGLGPRAASPPTSQPSLQEGCPKVLRRVGGKRFGAGKPKRLRVYSRHYSIALRASDVMRHVAPERYEQEHTCMHVCFADWNGRKVQRKLLPTLRGLGRECTGALGRLAGLGPRAASHPAGGSRPALALCSGVRRPSACASRAAAEQGGTTRVQASDLGLQGGASLEVTGQGNEWEGREAGRDTQLRIEPCVNLIREQDAKCN